MLSCILFPLALQVGQYAFGFKPWNVVEFLIFHLLVV